MSISSDAHPHRLAGAKAQLHRRARRPELPGRSTVCAAGRRGCPRRRQRRDGARGGNGPRQASRRRPRSCACPLRQHARPRTRRLLPHPRPDPGAVLVPLCGRPPADRIRAGDQRDRRRAAHVCLHEPERRQGGGAERYSCRDARARAGVPRETARRGRPDRRGADGEVPRRRGARPARGRLCAEARDHARRGVPRRVRRRDEEPWHPRPARPDRRGRAVTGARRAPRSRSRAPRRRRSSSRRSPTRSPGGSISSASSAVPSRPIRRSSTRAVMPRSGWERCCSFRARSTPA